MCSASGSRPYPRAGGMIPVRQDWITACSSMDVSGCCSPARTGATCRSATRSGRPITAASTAGAMPGFRWGVREPRKGSRQPVCDDRQHHHQRPLAGNRSERCFGRLKGLRRFTTRYDRRTIHLTGFLLPAASLVWRCRMFTRPKGLVA